MTHVPVYRQLKSAQELKQETNSFLLVQSLLCVDTQIATLSLLLLLHAGKDSTPAHTTDLDTINIFSILNYFDLITHQPLVNEWKL